MGRSTITAYDRAKQYESQGLYATDKQTVRCKFCNCSVSWEKKDNIDKHVASAKHVAKKKDSRVQPVQTSIVESINSEKRRKLEKDHFAKMTVEAFAKANIPLEKLENQALRAWIQEFTGKGGDLPCTKTLREKYLPDLALDYQTETAAALDGKVIDILCDETTDKMGRCVFVVSFHVPAASKEKLFVASVSYLDTCNATTCSRAVLDAMIKYKIKYENVRVFVTDGAAYMTLCFETLKVVIGDHFKHVQCWAHKLNLVGNIWVSGMAYLNQAVTAVKSAFLNTRKRKYKYFNYLEDKYGGEKKAKMFPSPVLTRWNSWFCAVIYLADYFEDVVQFFRAPEMKDIANSGIAFLSQLDETQVLNIQTQAIFVKEHAKGLIDLLIFLEGSKYPTAHVLSPRLDKLSAAFGDIAQGKFLSTTKEALTKLSPLKQASLVGIFQKVACTANHKLATLREKDPYRSNFCNIAKALSPTSIILNRDEEDAGLYNLPEFSDIPQAEVSAGYRELKTLIENEAKKDRETDIEKIICAVSIDHKRFAKQCHLVLWTPTNNVDSERLLSHYGNVVTDKRTRLTENNAELFTMLSFHSNEEHDA